MKFSEVVTQTLAWLQREGRVSYRALKREFDLDDEFLEDVKAEIIEAKRLAVDENGKVLVWTGERTQKEPGNRGTGEPGKESLGSSVQRLESKAVAAERRQLTVMFCDLVGSTGLSERLDPEELREVVQAYQQTSAAIIERYEGHIAQYLGDGLLVYFGYPVAHEDDAARAVRAGLEIIQALQKWVPSPLVGEPVLSLVEGEQGEGAKNNAIHPPHPNLLPQGEKGLQRLQVRIGIHTGQVVVGEIGGGKKREQLALGDTPNIAARVQGHAEPNSVVMSAATYRLVQGLFECHDLGPQMLKGLSTPLSLYRVAGESDAQSRFEVAVRTGLTPLVGREPELGFLKAHWEQAKTGAGQVVLLSGEPGIGKSRLVQELKDQLAHERVTCIEFRCSPYHQNSALYPIIDHLQRLLRFAREDSPTAKLAKLQHTLRHYRFPQVDTVPLLAALLSLPHPEGYQPITVSPQKQKEKTQAVLVAWLVEEAERQPVYTTWEDVHWADPSTLEVLNLVVDQAPTTRLYVLLTFRPEFIPPWGNRSHVRQLTLSRLERTQTITMVERVMGGKALPPEILQQIVAKTDGVPLFVEELTKSVVESVGAIHELPLQLGIPTTLHDALMARLDRLGPAKELAQLGATIGREFSYELLRAVSPLDEGRLQHGLKQLVEAELVYQRGLVPQAQYLFKHALIQDIAYQSLLKSTRQQYHQQIAQILEAQFTETVEIQPELLAHHYTEAGLIERAISYWQKAGEKAIERSAYAEAVSQFSKGIVLLDALPDAPDRTTQKLSLQLELGNVLMATRGYAAAEVERALARTRELCRQIGESPLLFRVLPHLRGFHFVRGELHAARELAEQLITSAQRIQSPPLLVHAYYGLGETLLFCGEFVSARIYLEQGLAHYDPQQMRAFAVRTVHDPGVACLTHIATVLWYLGYPDQALKRVQEAVTLAQELHHPFSMAWALNQTAFHYQLRQDGTLAHKWAEALITLASEQGFPYWVARGRTVVGWALAERGQGEDGLTQIHRGLAAWQSSGTELWRSYLYALLADAYGKVGRTEEGLIALAESLAAIEKSKAGMWEAELYRLKGELTLQREARGWGLETRSSSPQASNLKPQVSRAVAQEAEGYFLKAIEIARKQQAKSWELRATMSLARLWQQQGKAKEAHVKLAEIYHWFTEGFDTKDLQEAKALLDELS